MRTRTSPRRGPSCSISSTRTGLLFSWQTAAFMELDLLGVTRGASRPRGWGIISRLRPFRKTARGASARARRGRSGGGRAPSGLEHPKVDVRSRVARAQPHATGATSPLPTPASVVPSRAMRPAGQGWSPSRRPRQSHRPAPELGRHPRLIRGGSLGYIRIAWHWWMRTPPIDRGDGAEERFVRATIPAGPCARRPSQAHESFRLHAGDRERREACGRADRRAARAPAASGSRPPAPAPPAPESRSRPVLVATARGPKAG
jgi:hypothetical protein